MDEQMINDGDLMVVGKNDLIPGLELPTDVYVRLNPSRYVMVAKKGSKSSLHDLHATENNENLVFFVRKVDFPACVQQNVKIAGILMRKPEIAVERKAEFLKMSMDSVFRQIDEMGFRPQLLEHSKAMAFAMVNVVNVKDDYLRMMRALYELPGDFVKDAIAVSTLSILIGRKLGWQNANLERLALGAMLRDVGLKRIPEHILVKKRPEMSAQERAIWESHPTLGAEILRSIPGVPVEVVSIALEHHENAIGQGFPRRLRDFAMSPYSKIVCLADVFVELTTKREGLVTRTAEEAVYHMEYVLGLPFNKSCMIALRGALEFKGVPTTP